jgi:FtsZ-binding cell division protein ZapB
VLAAALASSGAQDAAHTARARAAERAQQLAEEARYAAERTEAARREARRAEVLAPTPQHAVTIELLAQRRAERDQLRSDYQHHLARLDELRAEYADLPRFAPRRRPVLADLIHRHETAGTRAIPVLNRLDMEIKELDRQVDRDTTARQDAARREETRHLGQALTRQRPGSDLALPRPVEIVTAIGSRHAADLERIRQQHYTRSRDHHTRGRDRDDGYSIGR